MCQAEENVVKYLALVCINLYCEQADSCAYDLLIMFFLKMTN